MASGIIERTAEEYEVPEDLLRAVIQAESSGRPWAMRYEPDFDYLVVPHEYAGLQTLETEKQAQKTSWGLMQVMGATARGLGFEGQFLAEACDPETNLQLGAQYLRQKYDIYGDWLDAVAAYNAGSVRRDRGTKDYVNQVYVDRVMEFKRDPPEWEWEKNYKRGIWAAIMEAVHYFLQGE